MNRIEDVMAEKIFINGRFLTQHITGVQRFAVEIAKQLVAKRENIFIVVPDIQKIVDPTMLKKFNIVEAKGGDGHFWEQIILPFFLKKNGNPLLINLMNTAPAFYKNQVVTHHDVTYVRYPDSYPFRFRLLYKTLTPFFFNNAKKIITVSEFSKGEISEVYKIDKSKIDVVYNAVKEDFILDTSLPKIPQDNKYILAVSSQNYHKNFHGLIEAFEHAELDYNLKIIGHKAKAFTSVDLTKENQRIEYLGRVSDVELIDLYRNASAFIFPSLYEGFGIPPLEAQACGCPVISSKSASMKEVLRDSAIFFDPENCADICNAMTTVLNDTDLQKDLIERGFNNVKRFSWENSASILLKIVEDNR
ncbi:glycosyltransferase family 4 protein [Klebsiella aerogenes]